MGHTFHRVGRFRSGYNPDQVDAFLERAKATYAGAEGASGENDGASEAGVESPALADSAGSGDASADTSADKTGPEPAADEANPERAADEVSPERSADETGPESVVEEAPMDEAAVRAASFDWVRNGYDPQLVDAALDRLETAFVQRRRAVMIDAQGEDAWLEQAYAQAQSLYPRFARPDGERFADAEGSGYSKAEVDEFVKRLEAYFAGTEQITATDVRSVTFKRARASKAYEESVVDAYLDRAVDVLLSVE